MAVQIGCQGNLRVSKDLFHFMQGRALRKEQARGRMPEIMEAALGQLDHL